MEHVDPFRVIYLLSTRDVGDVPMGAVTRCTHFYSSSVDSVYNFAAPFVSRNGVFLELNISSSWGMFESVVEAIRRARGIEAKRTPPRVGRLACTTARVIGLEIMRARRRTARLGRRAN